MFYWIYDYPNMIMGPLFTAGFVLAALLGQFLFRALLAKWVHTESRTNELVGISLASFAVLYGILLALVAVGAYTNYAAMDDLVSKEASCVASLYRDASAFPEPYRDTLQRDLKAYVRQTVDIGWPAQRQGVVPSGGSQVVTTMFDDLTAFNPPDQRSELIFAETFRQFNNLVEFRRARLAGVDAGLPAIMWWVVGVGAMLNLILIWMMDMEVHVHVMLTTVLSLLLASVIFLVIAMDHPFRGEVSVGPQAFERVYQTLMQGELTDAPPLRRARQGAIVVRSEREIAMPTAVETVETRAVEAVEAPLNYLIDTGVKPVNETGGGDVRVIRHTGKIDAQRVTIRDGRGLRDSFRLDEAGFELVDHPTQVRDFYDPEELTAIYYPEMQRLIAERSGARRVHVFDHTLRSSDEAERAVRKIREPVRSVHNDYTDGSGPRRVRDILPDEAEAVLKNRMAIIQVWRAINTPIERNPLAIADARSLAPEDFIPAERRFPDRVGEIYQFKFNPAHRWTWFPRMRRDEALVFKVYESETDGRARWGAHTSFDDPQTPPNAAPRESIEIRAFAFF